ncbi:ABC transporter substrate-binding protein [Kitasatospora sp. McL0602]|uniref:ABC transporter substrate-binding protein n=1 Tax=Kitasatospora sp. McL0602 TaxID=3439530 RepID=UPI003F8969C0
MSRSISRTLGAVAVAAALTVSLAACDGKKAPAGSADAGGQHKLVFGFSQVGAESGWRSANSKSIQDAAKAAGFELKFSDAQQKQENQIAAIRSFIQQKVDVIGFSPVVTTGWDTVLKEAKAAGIPVLLTDRAVDTQDKTLYKTFIGSDFVKEGNSAGQWLVDAEKNATGPVNIAELEGTTGSAPAIDRKKGFDDVVLKDPKFKVIADQSGDFTRAKGKEVMEAFLKAHKDINILFAHNDDMAVGAIQAIEEAGLKPGKDIKIVSIDGIKDAFQAMADGKIEEVVECNPLIGPQIMDLVQKIHDKQDVPDRVLSKEGVFTKDQAAAELPNRQY